MVNDGDRTMTTDSETAGTEQLNQGDAIFGINLDDEHCPDCGREILRTLFSYRAYCPICDTWSGKLRRKLGLVDDQGVDTETEQ